MYALKLFWNVCIWHALADLIVYCQSTNLHVRLQNGTEHATNVQRVDLLHSIHEWIQTVLSCGKHGTTMQIRTVSKLWLCRRSWRLEIDFSWYVVRIRKSHVCSNKLDVQETDMSLTQFNRVWNCFSGCRFAHGRHSRAWSLGFDYWCDALKPKSETEGDKSKRWDTSRSKAFKKQLNVQDNAPVSQGHLELSILDFFHLNANSSQKGALLYIFEDNEAVIKMIIKGRSPTMRHVSTIHRHALDWLFDRINLDQLADMLIKRELCLRSSQPYGQTLLRAKLQWLKFGFRSAEREISEK